MKTLICQRWNKAPEDQLHSLHLNEQHRLRFLNKNIRKYPDVSVKEHYKCSVEDAVYDEIIHHQTKHGLMFEDSPLPACPSHRPSFDTMRDFLIEMKVMLDAPDEEKKGRANKTVSHRKVKLKNTEAKDLYLKLVEATSKVTVTITKPKEGAYLSVFDNKYTTGIHPTISEKYRRIRTANPAGRPPIDDKDGSD